MTPIQQLSFTNFQSLQDTKIDLDPGLTVLVGPSNLGKSAALRAVKALVRNAPAPGLVREGSKEFRIGAVFADGTIETLTKGKNVSQYEIHTPDGKSAVYAKAGAYEAPEDITKLWGIAAPDDRELSFATQHESPFLLAEPASALAKVLGDLTNANMLMEAVAKANKLRTQALADEKARLREAEEAREELLSHAGINARDKALSIARDRLRAAHEAVARWENIVSLKQSYDNLSATRDHQGQLHDTDPSLESRLADGLAAVSRLRGLYKLRASHQELGTAKVSVQLDAGFAEDNLKLYTNQIDELMGETCPLCGSAIC